MKSPHNKRVTIWILGALATVSPFAIDLYLPAFAQIANDFKTTPAKISLSVTGYFIGMAIGQIVYGPMLDRFGRKRPIYAGLIIFIVASIGCMQSSSVEGLVVFRFVQALGGSVAWVAALAMVRDFFRVEESARIFSLLILILGVSPLVAPTAGGFIASLWQWEVIFLLLAIIAVVILFLVLFFLPEGHQPDHSVSLRIKPILSTFASVIRHPQFYTYTFSGAFSFATLFIYVAGSPVIFMGIFKVDPRVYGMIFALLSVGFIGSSQLNIVLTRKYKSEYLFRIALICQAITSLIFLLGVFNDWFGLYMIIGLFFICLACIGIINPNANALALAPFSRNVGSASALLGCTQIGVAAVASGGVGIFDSQDTIPVVGLMVITSLIALLILMLGVKRIGKKVSPEKAASNHLVH